MGKGRCVLLGLAVGVVFFIVLGSVTALIPSHFFRRMYAPRILDYGFLSLTSLLVGAYAGLHYCGKSGSSTKGSCAFAGGTISGVFSFACPLCNAILLSVFGVAFVSNIFEPARPLLGAVGVIVLGALVYAKARA